MPCSAPSAPRLAPPSLDEILSALTPLFAPELDLNSWQLRAADLLRALTGGSVISFAQLDPVTRQLDFAFHPITAGLQEGLPGFGKHMAAYPCFNFDPTVNEGRPFLRGDYLSDAEFYASPIYHEGFAKGGLTDHAAILMHVEERQIFYIGVGRQQGTFQSWEREVLTLLQPHLINAWQLARRHSQVMDVLDNPDVFRRAGLSARQAEILCLLGRGKSNAEMAAVLGLGLPTVKSYIKTLFDKLGVDNRHAALLRAHEIANQLTRPAPDSGHASAPALLPMQS